jgi:hypothetical protein
MHNRLNRVIAGVLIFTSWLKQPILGGPQDVSTGLNVIIIEGQGAINNVRQRATRDIVVLVEDQQHQPVSGASVAFALPSQGPTGNFVNNEKTLVVTTDSEGKAIARGMKPNNLAGKFEIRVTASYHGQTATTAITQFNMAVQNPKPTGNAKWIAILAIVGAAGAGGAVAATRGSKSATPAQGGTASTPIGITPGTGTVGAPQ